MMLTMRARLCLGFVWILGCAEGGEVTGGFGGVGGTISNGASNSGASGPGPTTDVSTASSGGSGGSGGEASGGGGSGGGGTVCNFTSPNMCANAESLPNVPGDESSSPVVVSDNNSKWFQLRVSEESSSINSHDLSYRASLISPPGMDYDLYIHEGPQDGNPNCGAAPMKGVGSPEIVQHKWNDDQGFGGEDDSVWLSIEVRYVSGSVCTSFDNWTLQIEGNVL
jgi:hypothetical protein